MTCMICEPCGGSRSNLDWARDDEKTSNDFRHYNAGGDRFAQEAEELCAALEQYKLIHRRRYISFEEMLALMHSLGYKREESN